MKKLSLIVFSFMLAAGVSSTWAASSTDKGANPNGKPFIEIAGQIVEVQNDISALEDKYNTVMDRIDALETDLQGQIDAINAEIDLLRIADAALQPDIDDLAAEADALGADVAFLLTEHDRITMEI